MPLPWSADQDVLTLVQRLPDGFVKTFVGWAANQTDAPLWYHVGTALTIISSVAPTHMNIGGDLPESGMYGNLFTLIVGRQGTDRKSTALKKGWVLLKEAVPERRGDEPGSPQGLIQSLVDRPQQILIYEDMADLFLLTQRRAGGNQLSGVKAKLLRAFDCDPVSHRLRRQVLREENPRLSILGGVNRPILDVYVDVEDWSNGLMSRFLVVFAARERLLHRRVPDPATRQWLVNWLGAMATYAPDEGAWGLCLGVDQQAEDLLTAFEHALHQTQPTRGDRTDGPRARTRMMAVKMAFLLCLSSGFGWPQGPGVPGTPWLIPGSVMAVAIRFALMSFAGALAITYTTTGSRDMQDRTAVLESIRPTWTPLSEIILSSRLLERRVQAVISTLTTEGTIEMRTDAYNKVRDFRLTGLNAHASGVGEAARYTGEIARVYAEAAANGVPSNTGGIGPISGAKPAIPTWQTAGGNGAAATTPVVTVPNDPQPGSVAYADAHGYENDDETMWD